MTVRLTYDDMPAEIYSAMLHVEKVVAKSRLDKRLLHFIKVRASQINGCAYCLDMHMKEALNSGIPFSHLYSLECWREVSYYSEVEKAVLEWTEVITRISEQQVPDIYYENFSKHFDNAQIGQITLAIIAINGWNRLILAIGTEPGSYQARS